MRLLSFYLSMAIFTPGAIISEIRGSIANVTYSRSRAGAISKQKLIQTNPNSPAQQAIRALQAAAVAAWQALPQLDQDLWIAFSSTQNSRPRIDGTHKLAGYTSFIRFYIIRNQYGLSGNPIPAPQLPLGNYSSFQFDVTASQIRLLITSNNINNDIRVISRLTGPLSPGISSVNQSLLTIYDSQAAPNGTLIINLLPAWIARWGALTLSDGMKIFARLDIVNRLTAQKSVVFRSSDIIDAPPLFVAISNTGVGTRAMTSLNGLAWSLRATAADNVWQSIAYSPSLALYCTVSSSGVGNRVMTSQDGANWTIRTSAADNSWLSIIWSPDLALFCAVAATGSGNRVMTSPDGINWTIRTSAANNNWTSITWSPSIALFCAVSDSGSGNRVMTSPDGITWAIQSSAADNDWTSIVASG